MDQPIEVPAGSALSLEELALHITVLMAADTRNVPVLRGKHAERDPVERDRIRRAFALWLAKRLMASNVIVTRGLPADGSFNGWSDPHRLRGCRACGASGHA